MGIEPTRAASPGLDNKQFGAAADLKCDGRVNFRGMWGHVGIHRWAKSQAQAYQCLTGHKRAVTVVNWAANSRRSHPTIHSEF
jgi:hypothetical protein